MGLALAATLIVAFDAAMAGFLASWLHALMVMIVKQVGLAVGRSPNISNAKIVGLRSSR